MYDRLQQKKNPLVNVKEKKIPFDSADYFKKKELMEKKI